MSTQELEQKIAGALGGNGGDVSSADIGALIGEVETAIIAAVKAAEEEQERALDPATVVDIDAAGAAVAAAELRAGRLRAAVPRLRERFEQARRDEYFVAWQADRDEVAARRDAFVEELRAYPEIAEKLVGLVSRIAPMDAEVERVNRARPDNARALESVERLARGVDGFGVNGLLALTTDLRLPKFAPDGDRYQFCWPLPQQSLAAQMVGMGLPVPRHIDGSTWSAEIDARNHQILEDAAKAAAESERRQRAREEREKAEIEAAKQRDREDYRARGWPPPGP
jgi:hypothetical protein